MSTRTTGLIASALFLVVILFHLSAKKQTSGDEAQLDTLRQPASWQGRPAPDLTFGLLNGDKLVLSDHVGKEAIVLNFFATWCGPCKEEMPELVRYAGRHRDEPFLMIGVDADEREDVVHDFVKEFNVDYAVAIDRGAAQQAFGVRAFPTTVFIGADGIVQLHEVGQISNADVAFEALYQAALAKIKAGGGITKEAFLELQAGASGVVSAATATEEVEEKRDPEDDLPPGRARDIAFKMNCPCGCTHKLMECTCKTAKDIKARLRTIELAGRKDEDVILSLNREFCMQ